MELLRGERPLLRVGHRGAPLAAPENSLEAIAAASELGFDAVEIDVVRLASGAVVLGHSPEEARPDAPELDAALALAGRLGLGVQLDVKSAGVEVEVAAAVRRSGLPGRALASSFSRPVLRALAAADPELPRAYTYPRDRLGLSDRRAVQPLLGPGLAALRATLPLRLPPLLRSVGARVATLHESVVSAAVVRRCHALGVAVWVWTVNDPAAAARLDGLGADAIISDDPGVYAPADGRPNT